jgi:glycine oxidase
VYEQCDVFDPRRDGHIVCGSSMDHIGFDKRPNVQTQQNIYKACIEMVPELANFPIVKQWAGLRPSHQQAFHILEKCLN